MHDLHVSWHAGWVWDGGRWNGHFPESGKIDFRETESCRSDPEILQKE